MKSHELQLLLSETGRDTVLDAPDPSGPRIEIARRILSALPPGSLILDVGCADGRILCPLAKTHEIHGVEITPCYVERAIKNGVHAIQHNIEGAPLPYPDGKFDAVFCGETIEHQVDTDWLLHQINRALKPGGKLVLTFPNIRTVVGIAMMLFCNLPPMYAARYRSAHFRDFTLRTVKLALQAHGFEFQRARGSAFYFPKIGEFGSALAGIFPSWAHTVVVEAVKRHDSKYSNDSVVPTQIY